MESRETNEDRLALQAFLMDINELESIEQKTSRFNAFETLGIVNTEIRHSNVLGWLMSPKESHGMGETFIKKFIQEITWGYGADLTGHDPLKLLLWGYHDLVVRREWRNIDLLAISKTNEFVLVIENKVWSKESRHQLKKYHDIIETEFPGYHKVFIYLTPFGDEASNPEIWKRLSYSQVVEMIEASLQLKEGMMETSVEQFLEQYIETLRRHVVGDNELEKICQDIYFKHKKALDLIFEYRPDAQSDISAMLKEMIEADENLIMDDSNKVMIRFTTKALDRKISNEGKGWTSSGRIPLFEFQNTGRALRIKLIIGPGEAEIRRNLYQITADHPGLFKGRNRRLTSSYTAIYLKNIIEYDMAYEDYHEKMFKDIRSRVEKFFDNELKALEQKIMEEYPE
ncbi:PD-(D/E)XK nuclease family protein [Salinicoccus roseus]|uniref:PDDEXK-like family protein n=1 Tax=Salinicoccus roseus TaxID=45670 RepID=UPI001CA679F2|nr:PD-(D/E)XK nuclease family protein [Salinicoccus roseus]MBY8909186.1 PD-(D/E)XK nuclease family protein [Salinicoccus roseus]